MDALSSMCVCCGAQGGRGVTLRTESAHKLNLITFLYDLQPGTDSIKSGGALKGMHGQNTLLIIGTCRGRDRCGVYVPQNTVL